MNEGRLGETCPPRYLECVYDDLNNIIDRIKKLNDLTYNMNSYLDGCGDDPTEELCANQPNNMRGMIDFKIIDIKKLLSGLENNVKRLNNLI